MQQAMTQTTFSRRAKVAFAKALTIEQTRNSVRVVVHHSGWAPLASGVRRQPMTWVTKSKTPIPIVTETGETIFRSATPKSMASGKWIHPGRAPTDFVAQARKAIDRFVQDKLGPAIAEQVRRALVR